MSKKSASTKTVPRTSSFAWTKNCKVIAVSFQGYGLYQIGMDFVHKLANGPNRKIIPLTIGDPTKSRESLDFGYGTQMQEGITSTRKAIETSWPNIPTNELPNEIEKYWSGEKVRPSSSADIGRPEVIGDGLGVTSEETMEEYELEESESREQIQMIPKKISPEDMAFMYTEFSRFPDLRKMISDYMIVVFGEFTTDFVAKFLRSQELQALVYFLPQPIDDTSYEFPSLMEEIERFKSSDDTKHIGLFVESLNVNSTTYFEEGYSDDFYDQFIEYLYDIEMLLMQYQIYDIDFVEITDEEDDFVFDARASIPSKEDSDDIAIGVYLDNLCNTVSAGSQDVRRPSFIHLSPYIMNDHDKIIVEEANHLIKDTIATAMSMVTYWRIVEIITNIPRNIVSLCEPEESENINLPDYYEMLSWEAFVQLLQETRRNYDKCCCIQIDEKCNLYILRCTYHKVLDVQKKFELTTRLCKRDFLYYITPKLGDVIRRFHREIEITRRLREYAITRASRASTLLIQKVIKETPKFSAIKFSDTYQELTCKAKIYRFEDGFIRCTTENWLYKPWKMTIELKFSGCLVYAHRWENYENYMPRVRIIIDNISCTLVMQEDEEEMDLYVQWPSDCQIHYSDHGGLRTIEQSYYWKRNVVRKRVYIETGLMIVYLANDTIRVLKANGIVYELYPLNYVPPNPGEDDYRPLPVLDVTEDVEFVRNLSRYDIYCEHFDVTRCDGRKLRILDGELVQEVAHYLIYEWMDYRECRLYAERDDGVKMVWSAEFFKCIFMCGTVLTTTVEEKITVIKFSCRSKSMENILRKINPSLVEKVAERGQAHHTFVTYLPKYLMQHNFYATVEFVSADRINIFCPHELKIVIKENHLVYIEVGYNLMFRINPGLLAVLPNLAEVDEKQWILKLAMYHNVDTIVSFQSPYSTVRFTSDGEMVAEAINPDIPLIPVEKTKYFLSKSFKFVMSFLDEYDFHKFLDNYKRSHFYRSDTKTVALRRLLPIDQEFCMPIPDLDEYMAQFNSQCPTKSASTHPDESERVFSARIIHKNQGPKMDHMNLVTNFPFTEQSLSRSIAEALDFFFGEKIKSKYSPAWEAHNKKVKADLEFKRNNRTLFNRMIRFKVFPRYGDFREAKGDVKALDLEKLKRRVDEKMHKTK